MDFSGFFGVVSTVDFALLGLWWVAVQARPDLRSRKSKASRASYLVSLQFVVPGTAALLAQVDPQLTAIWRVSFAIAGLCGAVSILLLAPSLRAKGAGLALKFLRLGAVPLYAIIAVLSVLPHFPPSGAQISALQLEALIFCLMVLLGAQIAWVVAMSDAPDPAEEDLWVAEPRA
jgi:cytochrome bd-type quinol oxidase subunit 2